MRYFILIAIMAASAPLFADGGAVLLHKEGNPFAITVFLAPAPPRTGDVDMSFLVQSGDSQSPVLDVTVDLLLTRNERQLHIQATHDRTQNKLLYAAPIHIEEAGEWRYSADIHNASAHELVSGTLLVSPGSPGAVTYFVYLALPFICLAVFALHQWLRWFRVRLPLS